MTGHTMGQEDWALAVLPTAPQTEAGPAQCLDRSEVSMSERRDPRDEVLVVERPWGQFQQFASNEPVTVKIITVNPGHRLSLQRHERRAEFWHVLDTAMEVTVDERTWEAQPGEGVWVRRGAIHRMWNKGARPGRVLEIAYGDF